MNAQNLDSLVIKLKLFKKINFLIYQSVLENFIKSDVEILKIKDSYSFSITYPNDPTSSIYLMVANFPEENGFVQTQIVDDRRPIDYNLSIINNYSDLINLIVEFIKIGKETLDISQHSDDSNHSSFEEIIENTDYLDAEDFYKEQEIKKVDRIINIFKNLNTELYGCDQ